jgi:hypothetical protein
VEVDEASEEEVVVVEEEPEVEVVESSVTKV